MVSPTGICGCGATGRGVAFIKPGSRKFSGEMLCEALIPEQPTDIPPASRPRIKAPTMLRRFRIGAI